MSDKMAYYTYSRGATENSFAPYLIQQADLTIEYPITENAGDVRPAFNDLYFLKIICEKPDATRTIEDAGCGICCLAMALLYKRNAMNTESNSYYAVKEATIQGTNSAADVLDIAFSLSHNYEAMVNVSAVDKNVTSAKLDAALAAGKMCMVYINGSHYVLIYGMDTSASAANKYMVADPGRRGLRTLTEGVSCLTSMRVID